MPFCTKCGKDLKEGEVCSCEQANFPKKSINLEQIITKLAIRLGICDNISDETSLYERNKMIVPECIKANEGEIPIKQYNAALLRTRWKLARAEGRIQITNKRLIFRAAGSSIKGSTMFQNEFEIDKISGVEIRKDHRLSMGSFLLYLIISFILLLLGVELISPIINNNLTFAYIVALVIMIISGAFFLIIPKHFRLKLIPSSISLGICASIIKSFGGENNIATVIFVVSLIFWLLNMIVLSFVPNLIMEIKTSSGSGAIQIRRKEGNGLLAFFFNAQRNEYTGFKEVLPWTDTDIMITEINAIIDDIQNFGDAGIDKWKK